MPLQIYETWIQSICAYVRSIKVKEIISKKIAKNYNQYYNENDEITVTAGATQAIFTTISALIHQMMRLLFFSCF